MSNPVPIDVSYEYIVAESMVKDYKETFLYNCSAKQFMILNLKICVWSYLQTDEVNQRIRDYIDKNPHFRNKDTTTKKFYKSVAEHLKLVGPVSVMPGTGIMTQTKFFNFSTGKTEKPDPKQFCFDYIDSPFEVGKALDPEVVEFLKALCNYDNVQLHVLRFFMKCCLLGVNPSQIIFFMMGPGGTGKSTFADMFTSIVKETSCTIELGRLSSWFETSRILGKKLIVMKDVEADGLTSKKASLLKLLINQDPFVAEKKYRDTGSFIYDGNILIHGNHPKRGPNDSTGLARQIIKFCSNTVPEKPNSKLPELLEKNTVQLIEWALTSSLAPNHFLGKVPALNTYLKQDEEDNMLGQFITNVSLTKGESVSPPDTTFIKELLKIDPFTVGSAQEEDLSTFLTVVPSALDNVKEEEIDSTPK